jgi:hypothetical protein
MRAVDPRERWQTLQSHLSVARGALAAGDKAAALEHIEAALVIDPEFLAARMLRDRVTSPAPEMPFTPAVAEPLNVVDTSSSRSSPMAAARAPTISPEALANFEERVMQRVREREAAASAVASVQRRRGRWVVPLAAAAAGFLAAMSSTTLYEPHVLHSRSIAMLAPLVALEAPEPLSTTITPAQQADVVPEARPPAPRAIAVRPAATAIAVAGIVDTPPEPVRVPTPPPPPTATAPVTAAPPPAVQPVAQPQAPRGVQMLPPRPLPDVAATNTATTSSAAVVPALLVSTADDRALVDQTLQRYRRAYNRLDARSAQAVYPTVNEGALARAFSDLDSQVLLFERCDIELQGRSANVTCRGSSHYVPKVGNHETRVERRVWNFTLRKDEGDWKIESLRAAR